MSAKGRRSEGFQSHALGARPRCAPRVTPPPRCGTFAAGRGRRQKHRPQVPALALPHCGGSAAVGHPLACFYLSLAVPIRPTHGGLSFLGFHAAKISAIGQAASSVERPREYHSGGGSVAERVTQRRGEIRGRLGGGLLAFGAGGDAAFCFKRSAESKSRHCFEAIKMPPCGGLR